MRGLTYDAGALVSAERADEEMWRLHQRAVKRGLHPVVPAAVLAQVWRGGPQVWLARLLKGCVIEALDDHTARATGRVLAVSGTSDVVDAAVVVGAMRRGHSVVTSDPNDLARLADALRWKLSIHVV